MKTLLTILVGIAMLATLGTLLAGMFGLVRSDGNPRRSNKLMQWRVALQALALALFMLLMMLLKS
jgi:Hypoxia induced protein conserved region